VKAGVTATITRVLTWVVAIACILVLVVTAVIELSPEPQVSLIRWAFDGTSRDF
jgi:hypothetical protein